MILPVSGGAGTGLMWGWLVASRACQATRPAAAALVLLAATVIFSAEIFLLTDYKAVAAFLGATIFALNLHLTWLYRLKVRLDE